MGVLFIGAMALIFYILLMRAQHLSSMEQRRIDPESGAMVRLVESPEPALVYVWNGEPDEPVAHRLVFHPSQL
jgi:hypothetical protein